MVVVIMQENTKTKVLFLITKSTWGGAQRYVFDMATNLPPEQFEPIVATGGDGPMIEKLKAAGVKVLPIPGMQRDISFYKELRASLAIARLIRQEDPDILHVNSSKAGVIGAILGRLLGVPKVIFTAHGWAFNEDRSRISKFIMGFFHWVTILAAHETITVSNALKSQMKWLGTKRKMHTVHNGGELPHFLGRTIARQKLMEHLPALQQYHNDTWSITIGELHPTKQHNVVIRAMADLKEREQVVRHIIIGTGELQNELQTLVSDLGLEDAVFFTDYLDQAASYLKAADVFILGSRSEALGYVILEAAQAALPIVASDVGGIPEIVTNEKEALLVPSGDVSALAAAIYRVLTKPSLAESISAAALVRSHNFSIKKMVTETTARYIHKRS